MQPDKYGYESVSSARSKTFDKGLQAHMSSVYSRMTVGLLVTAITAFLISQSPALLSLFLGGPQMYLFMFAPVIVVMFGFNPMTMSSTKLKFSFILISALYGVSFSTIAAAASGNTMIAENVARALFLTAGMFAGISMFAYTTKKDLSAMKSFIFMGMIGMIGLVILNMFVESSMLANLICFGMIIVFSGLVAWETQNTKRMYSASNGDEANSRMAWSAALNLYISFIAIFQSIFALLQNNSD